MILTLPVLLIYQDIKGVIISELGKSAMNIASSVASFIEQDIEPFKELASNGKYIKGSYDETYYEKMQETFRDIKEKTGVSFVYVEKRVSNTELAYIFDGEKQESKLFSPLGYIDILYEEERMVFDEKITVSTKLVNNPVWGELISGFAPIIDKKSGEVIALAGVDISLSYIDKIINSIKAIILTAIFIIIFLITVFVDRILRMRAKSLETDYLTGLYSKNYYESELDFIIRDSLFKEKVFCVFMIDIDDFKYINDHRGHIIGDKVLKSVANIMQENMRGVDICSRYGGDEFIVILPETTKEHAFLIGQRILDKISNLDLINVGIDIKISLSIGIVEWKPNMSAENLIECADQAMYISKKTGKNKVTIYKNN
ncbi:diguanylate cyclase (GGDEF)-like protein [Sedimentibacter acidaminivorans]|uniref:Diguanylate cyclase (GGDEF)-like protein n=1 Tax=Sedimentibacter acidaminivorans TaxID=913099 RepID=A0ABS4GAK9_9FIRM|nr:GGDEF domain-containing protein [Sedimentibacter acidaminivorans]MBP1924733.1 diguanylate cyclase (GGDEF)-like protein [Sedimentibacter acidaminivorans]